MATEVKVIKVRRGPYTDFDKTKMNAGEPAVTTSGDPNALDGKGVYMGVGPGQVKQVAMIEDIQDTLNNAADEAVDEATQQAEAEADRAEDAATQLASTVTQVANNTAGISELNERLGNVEDESSDLKEDFDLLEADLSGESAIQREVQFIFEHYIAVGSVSVVDINNPIFDVRYKYAILDCTEGDKFLINAYGGNSPRAYCFIDASNNKIEASDRDVNVIDTVITAPANSSKIIIQDRFTESSTDPQGLPSYRIIGTQGISNNFVRFDMTQNKTDAEKAIARENIGLDELPDGLSDDVKESLLACFAHVVWVDEHGPDYYSALEEALYAGIIKYGVYVPKKTINGQYIDEYGEIQNGTVGESFYIDDYIPVVRHNYWIGMNPSSLRVPAPSSAPQNESNWRISEYDEEKNFIKQTHFTMSNDLCASTLYNFDSNTKYMRLGWFDSNSSTNDKAFDIENPSEITVLPVEIGNIDASTGANSASTTRVRTAGYIPVSNTITVVGCPFYDSWSGWVSLWTAAGYSQDSFFYAIRCYDSNKEYLGGLTYEGANVFREDISNIPLLEGTSYVRFICQTQDYAALSISLVNHLITINGTKYYLAENA